MKGLTHFMSSIAVMTDSAFLYNEAEDGGCFGIIDSNFTVERVTFFHNIVSYKGGSFFSK